MLLHVAAAAAVATSALVAEPRLRKGILSVLYCKSIFETPPSLLVVACANREQLIG